MELLVLVPLTGFILFWQRWQNTSTSSAALHTVSACILLLFVGGLAGLLPAMRAFLLVLGTAVLVYELTRHRHRSLSALGSVSLAVFLAACGIYFLVHGTSEFRYYDEFSHWGIYLRDMVANGGYWSADTNSLHPRYVPGAPLWQYLFVFGGMPREGTAYFGQFILLFAPLLVLFESLRWKQAGWLVGILVLILFGFGNFGHGIASLYVDHVVAAWLAGIFLNFMADLHDSAPRRLLRFVIPLTALALIKDVGFFFALALAAIFTVLLLIRSQRNATTPFSRQLPLALMVLTVWAAGPILATGAWTLDRNAAGAARDVMSVTGLVGILTGKTKVHDKERAEVVRQSFPEVFLNQQLSKNRTSDIKNAFTTDIMPLFQDRFRLTTASFLLLFIAWSIFLIWKIVRPPDRLVWALGLSGLLGIALGYTLMLYLSYQYVFPRHDALYIASYIRYIHSVTLPLLLVGMAPLLPAFSRPDQLASTSGSQPHGPLIFTFSLLALLLVERPHLHTLVPGSAPNMPLFRAYIRDTVDTLRTIVGRQKLWLYLPDTDQHHFMSRVMLYELSPTPTTINRDFQFFDKPAAEILTEWANFDYVWLAYQDDEVDQKIRAVLGPDLGERLFRVTMRDGTIRLSPVRPQADAAK